ncbi:Spherulation-specific family 4 [Coniella lustricola]|uniref:Spherulation-specific family 4 n=1 Tax=Coniella lustricola TaxID=2025994 RepID=A0A2T2ZUE1_9PEZI|nr:Spherulation-specific family 4 [Coniella lustricola]
MAATTATASNVASRLLQHQQQQQQQQQQSLSTTSALQHLLQTPSTPLPDRPFILVPLYIYPTPEAWEPLYRAADQHPTLDFYVVVNPGNGPGEGALPDANYIAALARLTALRNVWVIGYVHCSYGQRPAEDVVRDIEGYARWEAEAEKDKVHGIFVDETPSSTEFVEYMAVLSRAAKTALNRNEAASQHPAIVIYNPGVVVDPIFYRAADYVVAFENAASQWTHPAVCGGMARLPRALLRRSIVIAHSSWGHGARKDAEAVTHLSKKAAEMGCMGHFITSRDGYTQWCGAWDDFVAEMARWAAME